MTRSLYESGVALDGPTLDRWNDGMSFILLRDIQAIRRYIQTGRNQVPTHQLLDRAVRLKKAWDSYRAALGI